MTQKKEEQPSTRQRLIEFALGVAENVIPDAEIGLSFLKLLHRDIRPEQLSTITTWLLDAHDKSLRIGPRNLSISKLNSHLVDFFAHAPAESTTHTSSSPYSMVLPDGRLVQWIQTDWSDQLVDPDQYGNNPPAWQPELVDNTLTVIISDRYTTDVNDGYQVGDEQPVFVPKEDATRKIITLTTSHLSPFYLRGLTLNTATHKTVGPNEDESLVDAMPYDSWKTATDEILAALTREAPPAT